MHQLKDGDCHSGLKIIPQPAQGPLQESQKVRDVQEAQGEVDGEAAGRH